MSMIVIQLVTPKAELVTPKAELVTPKAAAKREFLFDKPAYGHRTLSILFTSYRYCLLLHPHLKCY